MLQQPHPTTPKPLKTFKNLQFFNVFWYLAHYQNAPKKLPKFSQSLPKWAQHGHLGANMAHLGRNLLPTWLQLGPCCAQLRPNVSKEVFQNRTIAPQDAPTRAKTPKTPPDIDFLRFSTPPDLDFHRFFINLASILRFFQLTYRLIISTFVVPQRTNHHQSNASYYKPHYQKNASTYQPHYQNNASTLSTTLSKQCPNSSIIL